VQDIYNNPKVTKGPAYDGSHMGKERPNMFNEADRELHRQKRKTVGPAISERAMRFFEQDLSEEVDVFVTLLLEASQKNEVIDMTPRCERLGVDIVGRLAFGFQLKSQREPAHRHITEGIKARSALSSVYMAWPILRILNPVFTWLSTRRETDKENLYKSLRTVIGSRMVLLKEAKHDFYAQVSGVMPPDELWAEAILIVGAGKLILCPVLLVAHSG
jgi:cytochrome P450